jgi:hypothetical protein
MRAAILVVALAGTAEAQLKKGPSPEGAWTFKSSIMPDDCVLSGDMTVKKAGAKFTCSFTASWACRQGPAPQVINTQQTCTAAQSGSDITITSRIGKIVSTQPAGMEKAMAENYFADNFDVRISPAGDEMEGDVFDPANHARIKFERKRELIS